ncbi:MAG: DUF4837 family protein [candidate division WOR-3 bacterium]
MSHKAILAVLPLLFLLLGGCKRKSHYMPTGSENEIIFICDDFPERIRVLDSLINDTFYTPHETPLFRITPITYEQFMSYLNYKNILILSYPGSKNYEFFSRVFTGKKFGVFYRQNVFSENDLVYGIFGENKDSVIKYLKEYAPVIKSGFSENYLTFLRRKEYFLGFDKKLSKKILKQYGFTFPLAPGWVYKPHSGNFFTLFKHYPDRFIFCFTKEHEEPLEYKRFLSIRDSLTQIFYDGDSVLKTTVKVDTIGINNIPAIIIVGAWQNDKHTMGGGFINISLNRNGKFYMFDYGIYNPNIQDKIEYVMRGKLIFSSVEFADEKHKKDIRKQ